MQLPSAIIIKKGDHRSGPPRSIHVAAVESGNFVGQLRRLTASMQIAHS